MANNYTTKTAALKATKADINKLDAKKMLLNGKNILEYIKDSEFNSYDTRDPQLKNDELDIWNTAISLSEEGHIEVKPKEHSFDDGISDGMASNGGDYLTLRVAVKVIDNEVLGVNDEHKMYWQTDGLTKGKYMFTDCNNLTTFSSDLSNLTNGGSMFRYCENLETFSSDLPSLTHSDYMFFSCSNLTSFSSDLPSLTHSDYMFAGCTNLNTFSYDLRSLMLNTGMFANCHNLTSFTSDIRSLAVGEGMFMNCRNLSSFTSDLRSLAQASNMFYACKLDAPSVANIIHTLPTHESNRLITIGIGCDDTAEDQLIFAQECDCETWQELLDDFSAKNWTVTFQCNGRPTTTYNMRRGETLPIYAKLEEVIMPTDEKERKPHYAYTSADGSKFFNINYFHSTNGSTEGYDVFSSLEEAISTYNVTPKN